MLWLRDVAAYLNLKLSFEEAPTATEATADAYDCMGDLPLSALSQNMRKLILTMLQNCTAALRETFIETCIANTAHELAKGLSHVVGWRMLTQALAEIDPQLIINSLPRFVELRNSYQNRPAIGLAILWSVGQAGRKDVDYVARLLELHKVTAGSRPAKAVMDINNFCTVQVSLYSEFVEDRSRSLNIIQ